MITYPEWPECNILITIISNTPIFVLLFQRRSNFFFFAGGYKGYGLGFMVELFCGIMSGSAFGPHVRSWDKSDVDADLVCILHACRRLVVHPSLLQMLKGIFSV